MGDDPLHLVLVPLVWDGIALVIDHIVHIVLGKKVGGVGHSLELKVVARRILEKHGPLLAWLTLYVARTKRIRYCP